MKYIKAYFISTLKRIKIEGEKGQEKGPILILRLYKEAINDLKYRREILKAIIVEIKILNNNNTQKVEVLLKGANIVISKQVLSIKYNTDRSISKF